MNRDEFAFFTKGLIDNSVKKACYVVREYMRCEKTGTLSNCGVSKEEYDEALKIILAYSYQTSEKDTMAIQWKCDSDCANNDGLYAFCPGEFQIDKNSKTLCKYYIDPFNK